MEFHSSVVRLLALWLVASAVIGTWLWLGDGQTLSPWLNLVFFGTLAVLLMPLLSAPARWLSSRRPWRVGSAALVLVVVTLSIGSTVLRPGSAERIDGPLPTPAQEPEIAVAIALCDIPAYTEVTEDMVGRFLIPESSLQADYLLDPSAVIGRQLSEPVSRGTFITADLIVDLRTTP